MPDAPVIGGTEGEPSASAAAGKRTVARRAVASRLILHIRFIASQLHENVCWRTLSTDKSKDPSWVLMPRRGLVHTHTVRALSEPGGLKRTAIC